MRAAVVRRDDARQPEDWRTDTPIDLLRNAREDVNVSMTRRVEIDDVYIENVQRRAVRRRRCHGQWKPFGHARAQTDRTH